ncbi:MAG: sulfurtransferase TusA family protein [Alphaproteobacteria bacterium]
MSSKSNNQLDITRETCPMTFVKTRLLLEKMNPNEIADIILRQGDALENVPRSVAELGHEVLSIEPLGTDSTYLLRIRVRHPS